MISNLINFLYLNNFFRLAVNILKFLSMFDKKYNEKIYFFNFFKKRKKKYTKDILKILHKPKIFIFSFPYNADYIIERIYSYENLYKKNHFDNDGHTSVYQSDHNLEKHSNFQKISAELEKFINNNLEKIFKNKKLKIYNLWFVITKSLGVINKHSHFNSDFSGALYLNVDENYQTNDGLTIYNYFENIDIYKFSEEKKEFLKSKCTDKIFILKPKKNDLIIFNSYIEHGVNNENSKKIDRISLPFNLIF